LSFPRVRVVSFSIETSPNRYDWNLFTRAAGPADNSGVVGFWRVAYAQAPRNGRETMRSHVWIFLAAAALITPAAIADDDAAPPAPTISIASNPAQAPMLPTPQSLPEKSAPAAAPAPQTVTLQVVAAPAPAPAPVAAPQPVMLHLLAMPAVVAAPVPAAIAATTPAVVGGTIVYPGPFRRAIGNAGGWLEKFRHARVRGRIPMSSPQVVPATIQVATTAPAAPAVAVQAELAQPVMASPQAPGKHSLGLFR
jgi:hypothetical protein